MLRKYFPILFFCILFSFCLYDSSTAQAASGDSPSLASQAKDVVFGILGYGISTITSLISSLLSAIINTILEFIISALEIVRNFIGTFLSKVIYFTVVSFKFPINGR